MTLSGAQVNLIHENNMKLKISYQSPINAKGFVYNRHIAGFAYAYLRYFLDNDIVCNL